VFHEGGVIPGPVGQERMALVQSGEGIIPLDKMREPRQASEPPMLHADIYVNLDGKIIKKTVETTLDARERKQRAMARAGVLPT